MAVARRLRETMVETAAPCPGGVDEHAVKNLTAQLVAIEALIQKMPQKSPGLRHTKGHALRDSKRAA